MLNCSIGAHDAHRSFPKNIISSKIVSVKVEEVLFLGVEVHC